MGSGEIEKETILHFAETRIPVSHQSIYGNDTANQPKILWQPKFAYGDTHAYVLYLGIEIATSTPRRAEVEAGYIIFRGER